MSFKATFYTFSKKLNSTKRPTGTGTQYDIIIKSGSSIINPTIELQLPIANNPTALNYCHISEFGRYYFVHDWVFTNRLWVAELTVDPMATFKTNIGNYTGYVLRSAHSHDGKIVDTLYPTLYDVTDSHVTPLVSPEFTRNIDDGFFVLGVQGSESGPNGGAVTYYAMDKNGVHDLVDWMLNTSHLGTITDIEDDLLKCVFNPLQYIVSCMWFPINMNYSYQVGAIPMGWWSATASGVKLSSPIVTRNLSFQQIPKHPKAATRGGYLNMPPFSRYWMVAGPWGVIPIDNASLEGQTTISAEITVDLYTGSGRLSILGKGIDVTDEHICQIGVPIQLGQNVLNQGALMNTIEAPRNIVRSALSGSPTGMLTEGLSGIISAAELSQGTPSMLGSNGTIAFQNVFQVVGRFFDVADDDNTSRGRPLCKAKAIKNIPGYILCSDADPDIPGTDSELAQIVSYMNGGFYYE